MLLPAPAHPAAAPAAAAAACREEILAYSDPTIMHKLHLQLAIAEERFEDAKQ